MKFSTLSIRTPWKSQYFQKRQRNNVPLSPPINSSKAHKASGFEKEHILRFVLNSSDAHRSPWKFRRPGIEKFYAGISSDFYPYLTGSLLFYESRVCGARIVRRGPLHRLLRQRRRRSFSLYVRQYREVPAITGALHPGKSLRLSEKSLPQEEGIHQKIVTFLCHPTVHHLSHALHHDSPSQRGQGATQPLDTATPPARNFSRRGWLFRIFYFPRNSMGSTFSPSLLTAKCRWSPMALSSRALCPTAPMVWPNSTSSPAATAGSSARLA